MNSSPGPLSADVCVTLTVRVSNGGRRPPRFTYGRIFSPEGASRCNRYFQKYRNRSKSAGGTLYICIDKMEVYGGGGGVYPWLSRFRRFCYLEELSSDFLTQEAAHRRVPGGVIDTPEIDGWQSVHKHTLMIYRPDDNLLISPGRCHLSGLSD